jgi:hypothetical protein
MKLAIAMKLHNILPFSIEELPFIRPGEPSPEPAVRRNYGYYVCSTATINVEDESIQRMSGPSSANSTGDYSDKLNEIAQRCVASQNLVIAIHGYAVAASVARHWYTQIYRFMTSGASPANAIENSVFIGYRWPAEPRQPLKVKHAFEAMPTILLGIFLSAFASSIITYSLLTQSLLLFCVLGALTVVMGLYLIQLGKAFNAAFALPSGLLIALVGVGLYFLQPGTWLLGVLTGIGVFIGSLVVMLIFLRLSTYTRDRYRASNYGTSDLIELIRQLDKEIDEIQSASGEAGNKIQLSFVAHSLGCEVLTQTVRVLSDVFDPLAIAQRPAQNLGKSFLLSRLVLVAPDIPVESILSGRANFLKSSLKRSQESYLFSNEADLALRLASTAANYISFPAKTRFRGYKLGNITAQHFVSKKDRRGAAPVYGIVSGSSSGLEIRASSLEHLNLAELTVAGLEDRQQPYFDSDDDRQALLRVANRFTYFDCTDYRDTRIDYATGETHLEPKGVVSQAVKKPALNFWDYVRIAFFSGKAEKLSSIDVHGGYFRGKFTQELIYGLAFLGQAGLLRAAGFQSIEELGQLCKDKQIQVILTGSQR